MMTAVTVLAVLGAAGNVVLGTALCIIVYRRRSEMSAPEHHERVSDKGTRIISPYKDKEKRGDAR